MKIIKSLFFMMILTVPIFCQNLEWVKLTPLKSNRKEVEKILGKPTKYFPTFGIYQTNFGKFYVWYSQGGCKQKKEGQQWNIPSQKLTRIFLYTQTDLPLGSYVTNTNEYKKVKHPTNDNRTFYLSPNESLIYETITTEKNTEFVNSIELQPTRDKKYLLCKEKS